MCSLEKLNDKATQNAFNKKVVSVTQHLQAYVKHRLYIAESTGIIPKNMYISNDFIDEGIAKFYENGYDIDMDAASIKIKLFKIVDSDLDDLFKKEAFHKNTTSTSSILDEELESLEENFTVDEGFDFIMNEELDDISYKQNEKHKHLFLYDDNNSSVVNAFEIEDLSSIHSKNLLGKFYSVLPIKVSDILDLHVFGNLTYNEIAEVKNIETKRVERVISLVMEAFKSI
jgi:DNA-directed RNA polymerase specialized sigma24 family protein